MLALSRARHFGTRFLKSCLLAALFFTYGGLVGRHAKADPVSIYDLPAAPAVTRGKVIAYAGPGQAGSIVVSTKRNLLFYVVGSGVAIEYRVATAKRGFEWKGTHQVSGKAKWPDWRPPAEMRGRKPELPEFMAGGPENPLGARAIYLGQSIYRIHGTNEPTSIGKAASSGCIRMLNPDVEELYGLVKLGARVTVI
jgi:lipoprotein-anchoring transpeptidase ErfK/SrfK